MNGYRTKELSKHSSYSFLSQGAFPSGRSVEKRVSEVKSTGSRPGLTNLFLLAAFFVCFLTLFGFGLSRWSNGAIHLSGQEHEPIATTNTQPLP
jgi:hypothetical protein